MAADFDTLNDGVIMAHLDFDLCSFFNYNVGDGNLKAVRKRCQIQTRTLLQAATAVGRRRANEPVGKLSLLRQEGLRRRADVCRGQVLPPLVFQMRLLQHLAEARQLRVPPGGSLRR